MTLSELARHLGCRLEGDGTVSVSRVAGIEDAGPGDLTFLANPKYASKLAGTRASAVIVGESIMAAPCAMLHTPQPYLAFAEAVALLTPAVRLVAGISPLAAIDPTADLGPDVGIAPFATVGPRVTVGARTTIGPHVAIGEGTAVGCDCIIHAHASIREYVTIGDRVIVQNGAVIGSDGFGFARRPDGSHQKIPQVGRVVIEDDVEIGAQSAIDRPAVGETRIAAGTKIDNLVQVAHGVKVGRNALLAAQSGIAGSSVLEDGVILAGQAGVTGHVRIGQGAIVGAKSAVTRDLAASEHVTGFPAIEVDQWRESTVLLRRLPEFRKALLDLEARLAALEARLKTG